MKKHVIKICQTAYFELKHISSIRRFLTEDATQTPNSGLRHTSQRQVPESGVRSVDATKLCYFLYISSHGLTTATVSSWVHLILSSNRYRKFRTLLQDLFSWHPATTTQHLSWKNCTGFPFQNVLRIKSLVCVSVLWIWFWSYLPLWTAACLHSVSYTTLFFWHPHAGNPTIQTQDSWLSHLLLLWTPHLEFTPTRP